MRSHLPPLADATVVVQDPDHYRVWVSVDLWGGQGPFLSVDVLTHGPRDAVRGDFPPLPVAGTRGVVAFTRGDDRTGRWIGSQAPSLPDASTLSPAVGNIRYRSEWSGAWSWHGQDGTSAFAWPEGSTFVIGPAAASSTVPATPAPTRHVVAADGSRQAVPFTTAERNPNPPVPFAALLSLASGVSVAIGSDGMVTVTPAGASPTMVLEGDLHATGAVIAGWGGADQVGLQTHVHAQPDDSHGDVEAPTNVPTAGT